MLTPYRQLNKKKEEKRVKIYVSDKAKENRADHHHPFHFHASDGRYGSCPLAGVDIRRYAGCAGLHCADTHILSVSRDDFVCLLANKLVFKYGKKLILLIGTVCISAVGLLGYLLNSSIVLLYIWAALLGVGFGTILPTTSGVLAENYDEKTRGSIMGVQSVFTNIGAMYLTYVGGWAAAVHWHLNYLVYLYALIPAVLGIIFLPNDKPTAPVSSTQSEDKVSIKSLAKNTWVYGAITFLS